MRTPLTGSRSRSLADRLGATIGAEIDLPTLAEAVCTTVADHVSYDFACFATTDPASGVLTWASKTRSLGIGDEEFAEIEYGGPDINTFDEIARRRPPVGVLSRDTDGHPDECRRHREYMKPLFGFSDELRVAFVSRSATWGALALYRGPDDAPFDACDAEQVSAIGGLVADAIQRSLFRFEPLPVAGAEGPAAFEAAGPAVLIIDEGNQPTHITPAARAAVEELGGLDHGCLPSSVQAVVATTRRRREHFETRTQSSRGRWVTLRAAPLDSHGSSSRDVVVTVEPTNRATLSRLALAAHGLTTREEDVAVLVLQGVNTRGIAEKLHLSPHTVQDHLKMVFAKLGVSSRREMTARLVLD